MPGRRRADAAVTAALAADSDQLRAWHQAQASQIELDLQQHVLAALQSERDLALADRVHYATLYEQAPAGYLSLDAAGRIVRANQAAAELLGQRRDDLAGLAFEQFTGRTAQPRLRRFLAGLFASGVRAAMELTLAPLSVPMPGRSRPARRLRIEANLDTVAQRARLILSDLGSANRRDAARVRAFDVLDNIGEGVLVCDSGQHIIAVNPAFTRLTGYPAEDVLGRSPGFLMEAGVGQFARALQALQQGGRWVGEPVARRRDGSRYVAALSLTAMPDEDGGIAYFIGVFSDITLRRQAETALRELSGELDARVVARTAELAESNRRLSLEVMQHQHTSAQLQQSRAQLERLAAHQETVREAERQRIARDVHDELGQNLLALRIEIAQLQARVGAGPGRLQRRVAAALDNVDATVRSVRGIMNELRPAVLDLGLHAALEWQVQEFGRRNALACTLALPPEAQMPALPAALELALFRCLQEALANVRRHAQADTVEVRLLLEPGRLALSVADNGVGMAAASLANPARADAFGLAAMAQRMAALGGRLQIDSPSAASGCRLTLSFDL